MTTKTAATETELGELHSKVAKVMAGALKCIEIAQERYEELPQDEDAVYTPPPEANAALLGVVTKFLKDNNVTCVPAESEELSDLERILKEKRSRRRVGNVIHLDETG